MIEIKVKDTYGWAAAAEYIHTVNGQNMQIDEDICTQHGLNIELPQSTRVLLQKAVRTQAFDGFLNLIFAEIEVYAPLYWWFAFHEKTSVSGIAEISLKKTIENNPFSVKDFISVYKRNAKEYDSIINNWIYANIDLLNRKREEYLENLSRKALTELLAIMPMGYRLRRTLILSYKELRTIINLPLQESPEWLDFAHAVKSELPLAKDTIYLKSLEDDAPEDFGYELFF